MADDIEIPDDAGAEEAGEHHTDGQERFLRSIEARYGEDDDDARDREDGIGDDDAKDGQDDQDEGEGDGESDDRGTDDDTAADQPKSGKSATKRDGAKAEPEAESEDGAADDQPEGDEPEESEDEAEGEDDEAEDEQDGEEEDEGEISDDLKGAAAKHDIPLTLEDVKDETARKLVAEKLKSIDAGFTRAMQEARAYRMDEARFRAEEKYRTENPELVITEMLQKHPELAEKVQARLDKLYEHADHAEAFKVVVKDKRSEALKAIQAEMQRAETEDAEVEKIEAHIRTVAAKKGIPLRFAERAVADAIEDSFRTRKRSLTSAEIDQVIADEAKEFEKHTRSVRRETSKQRVQARTANRRSAPPPAAKAGAGMSPKPAKPKPVDDIDESDSEARIDRIVNRTAKRVFPGKK